jgi:hypothetical protein
MQRVLAYAVLLLAVALSSVAHAAACSSTTGGLWTDPIWGGACPAGGPTAADDVTINLAHAITFYAGAGTYAARSLTFSAPGGSASLTQQAGQSLTIGVGGLTLNSSSDTNGAKSWNINDGSATLNGPLTLQEGSANNARVAQINLTSGTLDINGNLTMTAGNAARTAIAATGAANIYLSGNFTLTSGFGTLSSAMTSTFTYDTAAAATVATGSAISYGKLVIDKPGGTATGAATGSLTVQAALAVTSGTLSISNAIAINGLTTISGTLTNSTATGAKSFTGGITINPGGTFNNNIVVAPVSIGGDFSNSGTFNSGTGTYTFNSTGQLGGSNPMVFAGAVTASAARTINTPVSVTGTFAISGANVVTNNSAVTASGAITGVVGSTWINAANSTLNVSGALLTTGTLNASATGNTVRYAGAAQTIPLPAGGNYFHLTLSGSGNKSPANAATYNILGNFTVDAGTTWLGTAPATDPNVNIGGNLLIDGIFTAGNGTYALGGNFTHNGTFTTGTGSFSFNGSAAQTLGGTSATTTFANLAMSNTATYASRTLTINHDITVTTLLTFSVAASTGGRIVTSGSSKVIVPSTGNITNTAGSTAESNFVAGKLQRFIAAGASTVAFPVGSNGAALPAAGYTPASLSFTGVAVGGGSLIVFVGSPLGDHPNIASSGLNASKSVNRWWALTTSGVSGTALPAFTNFNATFAFIGDAAPVGDRDSGAYASIFEIERWNGAWNATTPGARTGTTTQATGMTALGEFAIAEKTRVVPPPGDFNVFETATAGGAITGQIYSKLVGTGFSLDVVAILAGAQDGSNNNTVQLDLVTGSTGGLNCPGTPVAIAGTTQNVTLVAGRRTTGTFNVASAAPDVRVRVRYPVVAPTQTSCSTDNFSIRPTVFNINSSDATQTGTSGLPAIKTGANFNLAATSIAGYDGTPSIDNTKVTGTPSAGAIGGSFSAAPSLTGTASGSSFFYSEVGNFGLSADAIYDASFTSVDQPGDCVAASTSNVLAAGKYGCAIGSIAVPQTTGSSGFGRFIPDNFSVTYNTPVFGTACGTTSTYVGQAFNFATAPVLTVTARQGTANALSNGATVNYAGSYMKLTNAGLTPATQALRYSRFDALGGGTTPALDTAGLPATTADPSIGPFTSGVGDFTFGAGSGLAFARTTPSTPFSADVALTINVIDTDGVAFAGNPASFGSIASAGSGIMFDNSKLIRFGRLRLSGAYGSELLDIRVPVRAEYYAAINSWPVNALDSCTVVPSNAIALGNYIAPPAGASVNAANMGASHRPVGAVTLATGNGAIVLGKPSPAATGSFDLVLNLANGVTSAGGKSCEPASFDADYVGGTPAASLGHLLGNWCGASYDKAPSARVKLGASKAPYIYLRERY